MKTKGIRITIAALVAVALLGGCKPKPVENTPRQRMEAAQLVSEADFAISLKDWKRAEGLLAQAVAIVPDPSYWISLGKMRARLGNRGGAKDAYQQAVRWCEAIAQSNPTDVDPWIKEAYALALLGKTEQGRAVLERAAKRFPEDRALRTFLERKQFDAWIGAPDFKEVAL
jgi:tetratricopeptide (TPR) repeat protein